MQNTKTQRQYISKLHFQFTDLLTTRTLKKFQKIVLQLSDTTKKMLHQKPISTSHEISTFPNTVADPGLVNGVGQGSRCVEGLSNTNIKYGAFWVLSQVQLAYLNAI